MPEDNYDAAPDKYNANNHLDVRPQFSEDIENMMSGKNKSRQVELVLILLFFKDKYLVQDSKQMLHKVTIQKC